MDLRGRVALVTGGSRGIGRAIAEALARHGAAVVVNFCSSQSEAKEVVAEITTAGGRALAVQADVAETPQIEAMFRHVLETFSRVDILVNNAGFEERRMLVDLPRSDWQRILDVNLTGALICAQHAARAMIRQGTGGRIINITSIHQNSPRLGFGHYAVTKAGLWMLTKALAQELAAYGITVNAVAPGAIETDMNRATLAIPARREAILDRIPQRRIGTTNDVTGAVLFLVSEASAYVTGSTICVDGGLSI
ncbi:MAG: glucose 1-dehydrogenase [Armatimonadota bacterium]|nr:glucose 1-dehydrogenase [Armatimonadota bacterium]MDR7500392.1 glucose 1-dehydrogenase [Armatimonadota bacterium]MDR7548044.1 glucose 1-dehydrogenase [Armatimonadota bacterium]